MTTDSLNPIPQRRVVCAAIRRDEIIICGPRHFDPTMWQTINLIWPGRPMAKAEQGFIDQRGQFMSRAEAFEVAEAAGQIRHKTGNPDGKELFSEDIY